MHRFSLKLKNLILGRFEDLFGPYILKKIFVELILPRFYPAFNLPSLQAFQLLTKYKKNLTKPIFGHNLPKKTS